MMKIVIIGVLALAATLIEARSSHHVSQTAYSDLYHDCIGCNLKNNWFCGQKSSSSFGKCSDKPFGDCSSSTWKGGIDTLANCAIMFDLDNVDVEWP